MNFIFLSVINNVCFIGTLSGAGRAIIKFAGWGQCFLGGISADGRSARLSRGRNALVRRISHQALHGCCGELVRIRVIGSRARAHVTLSFVRSLVLASGGSLVAKVAQRMDRGSQQHVVRLAVTQSSDTHTSPRVLHTHARTYAPTHTHTPARTHIHGRAEL